MPRYLQWPHEVHADALERVARRCRHEKAPLILGLSVLPLAGLAPRYDGAHLLLGVWEVDLAGQEVERALDAQVTKMFMGHLASQGPQVLW